MMEQKFTPGPWHVTERKPAPFVDVDNKAGRTLAVVQAGLKNDLPALANARVMAAAPKMLAVLKDTLDFLSYDGYDTSVIKEVIQEAEGE